MKQYISRYILTLVALFAMTAGGGAWAKDVTENINLTTATVNGKNVTVSANEFNAYTGAALNWNNGRLTVSTKDGSNIIQVVLNIKSNANKAGDVTSSVGTCTVDGSKITATGINASSVTFSNTKSSLRIGSVEVTYVGPDPGTMVLSDAKTEATMEMPGNDVTIDYELVRDMSVQMQAQVGDGTQEQPRYRVKKDGSNWIPADMEMAAVPALFTVNDAIEQKALTQTQDYIVQIYAIDAEGQPTGDPMTFANFTFEPGIYAVKAVAADGSDYDGETALSNTFKLFQGYEVEIAAQSFATYYKDEPLKVDEETPTGELYTISSVTDNTVVLSEQIDAAPALTPLLVYNNSDEKQTILLIPQDSEPNVTLTVAPEFKGTLTAKTFTADDMSAADHYVLSAANQFVWVKDAGTIAANKCWLEIVDGGSNSRSILFGDATGIDAVNSQQSTANSLYDLNGRKLQNIPTKKGVYILNGHKVVIK